MGRNPERDAKAMAARKQKILANSFKVFSSRGIDSVSMNEVAKGCRIGCATLYRHYSTKPKLAVAVAGWTWETIIRKFIRQSVKLEGSAAEMLKGFLAVLADLCKKHADGIRYVMFFQVYARNEHLLAEEKEIRAGAVDEMMEYFHTIYTKAQEDGTLRTDLPEREMFSFVANAVMTTGSRICSGLHSVDIVSADGELLLLNDMILRYFEK